MPENVKNGVPYIEPERHNEMSNGVAVQVDAGGERRPDGTLAQGARTIPAMGGKARKGRTRLSHVLEGGKLAPESLKRARALRRALSGEVSATVGGGHCGIAASLFLKFAAQKTAAAEEAFERGDYETHRKLSESARMDILYAREHAAKEAQARPQGPVDPMARIRKLAEGGGKP